RRHEPRALAFMAANDPWLKEDPVTEWRGRLALRTGQWHNVLDLTRHMPEHLRQQRRWRYWELRSRQLANSAVGELTEDYASLAGERDFYGILAAERSRRPYSLNHQPGAVDARAAARAANTAGIHRAREVHALPAVRSRRPYALNHQPVAVDARAAARVANTAGIIRAREFHARGDYLDARREWYHAERLFSREELIAQAALARQMDWYFPAIRGISKAQ